MNATECFLAVLLALLLLHGLWLYRVGVRLHSIKPVYQPTDKQDSMQNHMCRKVTLTSDRRLTMPWLMVADVWTRTGGDGGAWICRRLLFPWGRCMLTYTSSFTGAPRGIYQLARTELTIGDWFGWFRREVALVATEADTPPCFIAPAAVTGALSEASAAP